MAEGYSGHSPGLPFMKLSELEDGRYLCGDSGKPIFPPDDFDMQKFHRGRCFFRDHIFSCIVSMTFSLIIGMSLPELLEALVFTNQSNTPSKALKRYEQTFKHVALWHYGNVWDEHSEASKSIKFVRNMHRKVRKEMDRDANDKSKIYLSQYDMGIVQSGFMGVIVMYHDHVGINCLKKDIDDYVYFWYGIGHLLGIEKKYNICAYGTAQALFFCKEIEEIICKELERPSSDFDVMTKAAINGFNRGRKAFVLLTFPVIRYMTFEAMSRKSEPLDTSDKLRYFIFKCCFFCAKYFSPFNSFIRIIVERIYRLTFFKT